MIKRLNIGTVDIHITHNNYCNTCKFRRYINHEIGHCCLLLTNEKLIRDGNNFLRLKKCKERETE
ncbi:MAG: hypothetical protein M0R40_00565 [Firmicutes bacterium]|nr:hypothetical protein [Bacillota bacterium]